jgi:antitoxin component of RelBE/YafQ-DinJ toxin-antitoxin module
MDNKPGLPMLPNRIYSEQINVKVDDQTKHKAQLLKGHGVDTAQLFRDVITKAIDAALEALGTKAS